MLTPRRYLLSPTVVRTRLYQTREFSGSFADSVQKLVQEAEGGKFLDHNWVVGSPKRTVSLLHPPGACSAFTRSGSQYPPLGLLQLKALIGDTSRVDVLEADAFGWTPEETVEHLKKDAPLALGMTVTCGTKALTNAWSTIAKNLSSSYVPLVIVGGPAAAFETSSIMDEYPNVDVVVKGEGEVTFPKIVSWIRKLSNNNSGNL